MQPQITQVGFAVNVGPRVLLVLQGWLQERSLPLRESKQEVHRAVPQKRREVQEPLQLFPLVDGLVVHTREGQK